MVTDVPGTAAERALGSRRRLRRTGRALLLAPWIVAACHCGEPAVDGDTTLTIDTPAQGASFATGDTFIFHATAANPTGVISLALQAGGANGVPDTTLETCEATGDGLAVECAFTIVLPSQTALIGGGRLTLTAAATDYRTTNPKKTITVNVGPFLIQFVQPPITAGTTPPVADVSTPSPVAVLETTPIALASMVIVADGTTPIAQWLDHPTGTLFQQAINWNGTLSQGLHHLTATATDLSGAVATAEQDIDVLCATDADCGSDPGTLCCVQDGLCHPTVQLNQACDCQHPCGAGLGCCSQDGLCHAQVTEGDDCDCFHPCAADQGCFPGICGALPQKCRPGCYPGSTLPPPYGTAAAVCAPQDGVPAYCTPLPMDQVTVQNQGGACAVGDACDVLAQDCPDLALNRSMAVSATNPLVPYRCVPIAPNVNRCMPAGTIPIGGENCLTQCSTTAGACVAGAQCVQNYDGNGQPSGPATCLQICTTEEPGGACPANESCAVVVTLGAIPLSSGGCQ